MSLCVDPPSVNRNKVLIGERFPGMLVDGTITDSAYADFMQSYNETSELGLRTCNLEAIMNEVQLRVRPSKRLLLPV